MIEIKRLGITLDTSKHKDQLLRYLKKMNPAQQAGSASQPQWKGVLTNGREWFFYEHETKQDTLVETGKYESHKDTAKLERDLGSLINPSLLVEAPTNDPKWIQDQLAPFESLAAGCVGKPFFDVKLQLWEEILAGVHFDIPNDPAEKCSLFSSHTMLVVLARSIGRQISPSQLEITEGFAKWVEQATTRCQGTIAEDLRQEVDRYNWNTGRDVLKDLYHSAIPSELRHDFGEYYTPDWLAEAVVEETLDKPWVEATLKGAIDETNPIVTPQVLDPACGSGTFINAAIRRLRDHIGNIPDPNNYLDTRTQQASVLNRLVAGIDMHPVAVELAQATKLMALGTDPEEPLNIWLGDSLQWNAPVNMTLQGGNKKLLTIPTLNSNHINLPEDLIHKDYEKHLREIFDVASNPDDTHDKDTASGIVTRPADIQAIKDTIQTLRGYILSNKNGVWKWFLDNSARPLILALKNRPSRLVGNPPWVSYEAMNKTRRAEFQDHSKKYQVWVSAGAYKSSNDLAALFVATCVDYYLDEENRFGFVLPYSALKTRHWEKFRSGNWVHPTSVAGNCADLYAAWDFSDLKEQPFKQSKSCAVFGRKQQAKPSTLTKMYSWTNKPNQTIDSKETWANIQTQIDRPQPKAWPTLTQTPHYAKSFKNGANIKPQPLLLFETSESKAGTGTGVCIEFKTQDGKKPWRGKEFGARTVLVEKQFKQTVLRSRHLVSFGVTGESYFIAPIVNDKLEDLNTAAIKSATNFSRYWRKARRDWGKGNKKSSADTLDKYIDGLGKLSSQLETRQNPDIEHKVIYNLTGSKLYAAVTNTEKIANFTLLQYSTSSEEEAHYLCAILNADNLQPFYIDACKESGRAHFNAFPTQRLPIPAFDTKDAVHMELANLSKKAHQHITKNLKTQLAAKPPGGNGNTGQRELVRADTGIQTILNDIDKEIKKIFDEAYWR